MATFNSLEDVTDAMTPVGTESLSSKSNILCSLKKYLAYGISLRHVAQVIFDMKYLLMIGIIGTLIFSSMNLTCCEL